MSSFIFNSKSHRNYAIWLLVLVLTPLGGLFLLGVCIQPLDGDLTRLGYFAERDFGWNAPQLEFLHPALNYPQLTGDPGKIDRYYDVVVLGDSFSWGSPRRQWQNYLAVATGWSIVTLDINRVRLGEVLASREFQSHPPRLLIYESVERELPHRMSAATFGCEPPIALPVLRSDETRIDAKRWDWDHMALAQTQQRHRSVGWDGVNLSYLPRYLWNNLRRQLDQYYQSDALRLALSVPAPFSNRDNRALLLYKDDFNKIAWWQESDAVRYDCWIDAMRHLVESNRHTRFLLMVAPDKLTAYADFFSDADLKKASALSELAERHPGVVLRLDKEMKAAILRGEQDVYLPNDTHWGSSGNRIAAETVLALLARR